MQVARLIGGRKGFLGVWTPPRTVFMEIKYIFFFLRPLYTKKDIPEHLTIT